MEKCCLYKKECNINLQSSKPEQITFPCEFLCLCLVSLGQYCQKYVNDGAWKKIWKGDDHIGGGYL